MKITIISVFLYFVHINLANSSIISAGINYIVPNTLTNQTEVIADFGVSGDSINFLNLDLIFTFDTNILDANNSLSIQYLTSPSEGSGQSSISFSPRSTLTYDITNLYIDNDGFSTFTMSATGDGVHISNISLSGNATVVPLPSAFLLFSSGLIALIALKKRANKTLKLAQKTRLDLRFAAAT